MESDFEVQEKDTKKCRRLARPSTQRIRKNKKKVVKLAHTFCILLRSNGA